MKAGKIAALFVLLFIAMAGTVKLAPRAVSWYMNLAEPSSPKPLVGATNWSLPVGAVASAMSGTDDPPIPRETADKKLHNPQPATPGSVERGKKAFVTYCLNCHGAADHSNGPITGKLVFAPPYLPATVSRRSDGYLYATIRNGGLVMPSQGYRIGVSERWDIVNYLRSIALPVEKPADEAAPTGETSASAPAAPSRKSDAESDIAEASKNNKALEGDASRGKGIFDAKCRLCHESDSDQANIRPGLKGLFQWPPHKLSDGTERQELTPAIVRKQIVEGGGKMPPVGSAFSEQDIADLLVYLQTL